MFAANLSNAAENNAQNITTVPVNLLKVVELLSTIASISKTQSFTVDKNTMEVCTHRYIYINNTGNTEGMTVYFLIYIFIC